MTVTIEPWLRRCTGPHVIQYKGRAAASLKKVWHMAPASAAERIPWLDQPDRHGEAVTPYTIRHTMATELRRRSVPLWNAEGMLGHRADSTSERYARFDPDDPGKAAAAIDAYFRELDQHTNRTLILPVLESHRLKLV